MRRRGAGGGRQAQAAVLGSAAHEDRSPEDVHRHDGDVVRHDRDRAGSEDRAADREQLRVPGEPRLLRRPIHPPHRYVDRRPAGRRPHGHRLRRTGVRHPRRAPGRRAVRAGCLRDGERGPEHRRQPVLHHHRRQRSQPGLQPELHDLRPRHQGTRCGATDPEAADQGSGRGPAGRHQRPGAAAGGLLRLGDDHREVRACVTRSRATPRCRAGCASFTSSSANDDRTLAPAMSASSSSS